MKPRTERNKRRDQTARLPGHWRHLGPRTDSYARAHREAFDESATTGDQPQIGGGS